jgi:hypothetical protein
MWWWLSDLVLWLQFVLSLLIGYTCKNRNLSNSKTISPFILYYFIAYILYKCCLYCQWSRLKFHHLNYSLRFRQLYSATDLAILFSYCFIQICKNWYSSSLYLNNKSIVYIRYCVVKTVLIYKSYIDMYSITIYLYFEGYT